MFKDAEVRWEQELPKHTFSAIRVDGKNFSKLTKGLRREHPFNVQFSDAMLAVAEALCEEVEGACAVYVGSDEVSVVIQDMGERTEKWFGGRVQKIASVSASIATAAFTQKLGVVGLFDARVFDLSSDEHMVGEYLEERRLSVMKNSVSMYASHHFSHRTLHGMGTKTRKSLLRDNGYDWDELPAHDRVGTLYRKHERLKRVEVVVRGEEITATVVRKVWEGAAPEEDLTELNLLF